MISPLLLGQYFTSHRLQAIAASALIATVAMLFIGLVWYALILWNSFMLIAFVACGLRAVYVLVSLFLLPGASQ